MPEFNVPLLTRRNALLAIVVIFAIIFMTVRYSIVTDRVTGVFM